MSPWDSPTMNIPIGDLLSLREESRPPSMLRELLEAAMEYRELPPGKVAAQALLRLLDLEDKYKRQLAVRRVMRRRT